MRRLLVFALLVLCASLLQAQAEWPRPKWRKSDVLGCRQSGKAAPVSSAVGKFQVRIEPVAGKPGDDICRATLLDRSGKQIPLLEDWNVSIHQGTGEDAFGDGNPSLILEGFSGGTRYRYTYRIVGLGEPPVILPTIENAAPFYFFKDKASGQFRIMASDGVFDYFDGMCYLCAPFPRVVLRVDADGLHDVSSQFTEQYDSEIALARAKIGRGNIGKFLIADFDDVKGVVLEIVLAYLYSGREAEAWQTLDEMWPADDRERIKKLILKTKTEGILSKLGETKPVSAKSP